MKDLSYQRIQRVLTSWEATKQLSCSEESVGRETLLRLFELEPRTKVVFGLDEAHTPAIPQLESMGQLIHAVRMLQMLDSAFSMLGPDTETLEEMLQELGERHVRYGVKPSYVPFLGKALVASLSKAIPEKWDDKVEAAWIEVYEELSGELMRSMLDQ